MVLIFSDRNDATTEVVLDWLKHLEVKFLCIYLNDSKFEVFLEMSPMLDLVLRVDNHEINLNEITAVWFRRGELNIELYHPPLNFKLNPECNISSIKKAFISDKKTVLDFIYRLLDCKKRIGSYYSYSVNKLYAAYIAEKSGLNIPETMVTSSKHKLIRFKKNKKQLITKSIQSILSVKVKDEYYSNYTERVSESLINDLPENFSPSLFQTCLEKEYELRIFYLQGKCYTMAIFSQQNKQTEVDFRKYDDANPNRTVPYQIPNSIKSKIKIFMDAMNLNTGSIDMVVTKKNKYVFLEVNPVGQFSMVSVPCNYFLEKKIAEYLI